MPSWADQLLPQLLMEQFETLPIQFKHIEHMHEGENLDNFFLIRCLYMHLRICLYNLNTLNICMKEFGSQKIIFDEMTAVRT